MIPHEQSVVFTDDGHTYTVWSISECSEKDWITWIDGDPEPKTEAYTIGESLNKAMQVVRERQRRKNDLEK